MGWYPAHSAARLRANRASAHCLWHSPPANGWGGRYGKAASKPNSCDATPSGLSPSRHAPDPGCPFHSPAASGHHHHPEHNAPHHKTPTCRATVSYTHLRAHETDSYLVCRLLLEKKKKKKNK